MSKVFVLVLVLVFLTASCVMVAKPAFSSTEVTENSWMSKAPMQQARSYIGVGVINGKIYAIGGSTQHGSASNSFSGGFVGTNEEYDPAADTWTYKSAMPTPRQNFATAVYHGKIYCIGGYLNNGTVTSVNEVYDPATDTWETKAPIKTTRISLQANAANGKIYLIGGYVPAYYTTYNFTSSSLNEAYDPATDSWTTKAPMPIAMSGYASAVVDNKIYVFGGFSNQIYDSKTNTWSQGTSSPTNTAYGAAGATTGVNAAKRIYVLSQDYNFPKPLYVNSIYDPATDSWTAGAPEPTERKGFSVAVVNDTLYVIGGTTEAFDFLGKNYITVYATNEQYTPIGYGTVPATISVGSPENKNYTSGNVSLAFTLNKPTAWMGYSLDGQKNATITGNTTIAWLTSGLHNITVYANDTFGNTGASQTVTFSITSASLAKQEPFPTAIVAAVSGVSIAIVVAGLLVYFKKRKHRG